MIRRGLLKSFNSLDHTATVQLSGSDRVYLDGVKTAGNIDSQDMVAGREVVIVFFDENNSGDSVIIAVY